MLTNKQLIKNNYKRKNYLWITIQVIFISSYPILSLLSTNYNRIYFRDSIRSLSISVTFFLLFFFLFTFIIKSPRKSMLITTSFIFFFFYYGHVYKIISRIYPTINQQYFLFVWIAIFFLQVFLILIKYLDKEGNQKLILIFSLVLISQPIFSILIDHFSNAQPNFDSLSTSISNQEKYSKPDIYYIILDAYARDDVLLEQFNFDNSSFLSSLEEIGFYVARCSQSNYSHTKYSIGSSLNLNYIESFYDESVYGDITLSKNFDAYVSNNKMFSTLKNIGYKTVAFQTTFPFSEITNADYYLTKDSSKTRNSIFSESINRFEYTLIQFSLAISIKAFPKEVTEKVIPPFDILFQEHRDVLSFTLESLSTITSEIIEPIVVFAHILSPHVPHIYGPDGEILKTQPPIDVGYTYQVKYINNQILNIVSNIIKNSTIPPIILIQADHGARIIVDESEQLAILNAYYAPEEFYEHLYPSISPVNSFRKLFNYLYDANYEYLEDISYYSNYNQNYKILNKEREGCDY